MRSLKVTNKKKVLIVNRKLVFCFLFFFPFLSITESPFNFSSLYEVSNPVFCEELADEFCKSFWSSENQGNFQFSNGTQVLYGDKRKDVISHAKFIYNQKLAKSRCQLPEDLKHMMGIHCGPEDKKEDLLAELELLLSQAGSIDQNREAIKSWQDSINKIHLEFEHLIEVVAFERAVREMPDLSKDFLGDLDDYHPGKMKVLSESHYDIKTEIMDAVYLDDPDWHRIVVLFEEVRADVLTVIDQMVLTPETKQIMKEKIRLIKLSLPYEDPRTAHSGVDCATYKNNAAYDSVTNSVYLCMGSINTSDNVGTFYGIIAHEMAHSIDPNDFLKDMLKQSPLFQALRELYESNASLSCEEWEKQKATVFVLPSEIYQLPEGLAAIDQCLENKEHLNGLNSQFLDYVNKRIEETSIRFSDANRDTFSYLTTLEFFRKGVWERNEFYLEPKLLAESYFKEDYFLLGHFHKASVFVQEYKCRLFQQGITKEQAFADALEETKRLNTNYEYSYFSVLGRNSEYLEDFNLSKFGGFEDLFSFKIFEPNLRHTSEDFADFVSFKTLELKLQRISSLKERRDFILAGTAFYCGLEEKLERLAEHEIFRVFTIIGKKVIEGASTVGSHSPDRDRRLRQFTSKIANLLQCIPGEDIKKLGKNCDFLMQNP